MKTINIPKQNSAVLYTGTWFGLSQGYESQLEDAYENNGAGQFGLKSFELADSSGASAVNLIEGVDYNYDERLDEAVGNGVDIYDDGVSGALTNKVRIVNDGKNITDSSGLNLKVRAKNLSVEISPPSDECYIDPKRGKVVLPRPIYWNKCESTNSNDVEIGEGELSTNATTNTGKYGNCYVSYDDGTTLTPNINEDLTEMTFSSWVMLSIIAGFSWQDYISWKFNQNNHVDIFANSTGAREINLVINNSTVVTTTHNIVDGVFRHVFITITSTNVKVVLNGTTIIDYTGSIAIDKNEVFASISGTYVVNVGQSSSSIDNLKIWNTAITSPDFEYNSGAGREDALHPIYVESNGYKPKDLKTGYFYIPDSVAPAQLTEANATGASVKLTI